MRENSIGVEMFKFCEQIFPICRSITGEGVRQTLDAIKSDVKAFDNGISFEIKSVPSGTKVFDWTVPKEWRIREAYISDEFNRHIIDFKDSNLYIMGYSIPVDRWVDLEELKEHIYTQPDQPEVIPYVTSYYSERFGFCMSENMKQSLKPGKYHMYIDSELFNGVLNYAECYIEGESPEEVFFSTYVCHPSMANNECSGPTVQKELIKYVKCLKNRRKSYRFVFIPETIGSISYLSIGDNLKHLQSNMIAGFNLSCVGDDREYSLVETRNGKTLSDKALKNILFHESKEYKKYPFIEAGSDERQYNAPFVDLPVAGFCRSKYGTFPEYHTSADKLNDVVTSEGLQKSFEVMVKLINALEHNENYRVSVLCEPQLGKRGLYPTISQKGNYDRVRAMVNFLKYCDGTNDIFDISNIIGEPVDGLIEIIEQLRRNNLIDV